MAPHCKDKRFCGCYLRRKRNVVDRLKGLPEASEIVSLHLTRYQYRGDRHRRILRAADAQVVGSDLLRHRRRAHHTQAEVATIHQPRANHTAASESVSAASYNHSRRSGIIQAVGAESCASRLI
jgi:hypothetical protein